MLKSAPLCQSKRDEFLWRGRARVCFNDFVTTVAHLWYFFVPQNNYVLGDENIFSRLRNPLCPKKYEMARKTSKAYTNYLKGISCRLIGSKTLIWHNRPSSWAQGIVHSRWCLDLAGFFLLWPGPSVVSCGWRRDISCYWADKVASVAKEWRGGICRKRTGPNTTLQKARQFQMSFTVLYRESDSKGLC